METTLYTQIKEYLSYCESKIDVYVNFDFAPTLGLDPILQKLLFGDGNVLLKTPEKSLQHQTLALAIYLYILNDNQDISKDLTIYGHSLVHNALLNIKFTDAVFLFGFVDTPMNEIKDTYYKSLRYSARDTETTRNLNTTHLKIDFERVNAQERNLTQFDILSAFYGFNMEFTNKFHCMLLRSRGVVYSDLTYLEFVTDGMSSNLYSQNFIDGRYIALRNSIPRDIYTNNQYHFRLLINQIKNSTYLNTITDDVNKYIYTPRITKAECRDGILSLSGRYITIVPNVDAYIKSNEQNKNLIYGVMMLYDFENDKFDEIILGNDFETVVHYASGYEYGMVVAFHKDGNTTYDDESPYEGSFTTQPTDKKKLYYIKSDAVINFDNIKLVVYIDQYERYANFN